MQRQTKTMARGERTNRKWAVGALVALTMLGAMAATGGVGAKPAGIIGPDLPADFVQGNRIWIEDINGPDSWIEVDSFSWGVDLPVDTSGGGGGSATGKASFQDFHFTTHLNQYSPEIAETVVSGKHIKRVVFEDFGATAKKGNETVYLKITLSDCLISSYHIGGSSGDNTLPMESISLNYAKIEFRYVGADPSLSSSFTYDLKAGKF